MSSLCGQRIQHYCYHKAYGYLKFLPEEGRVTFTSDVLRATAFKRSSFALNYFTQVQRIRVSWEQAPLMQERDPDASPN
jgi:hypothetical protein